MVRHLEYNASLASLKHYVSVIIINCSATINLRGVSKPVYVSSHEVYTRLGST